MLEHQVETSFLLRPLARKTDAKSVKGKGKKSRPDKDLDRAERMSDSTESEEDLAFAEKMVEQNKLGELEKKLLLGIV